jgi:hypothetical protein
MAIALSLLSVSVALMLASYPLRLVSETASALLSVVALAFGYNGIAALMIAVVIHVLS